MGRATEVSSASASEESSTSVRALLDILRHQREGFFFAVFALAQSRYSRGIPSIACEVVAAESFHCENRTGIEEVRPPADAVFASPAPCRFAGNRRAKIVAGTARRTSHGLRVKATVAGIASIPRRRNRRAATRFMVVFGRS